MVDLFYLLPISHQISHQRFKELENCQEAIVVIGEASESEDDLDAQYRSDQSFRSSRSESMNLDMFTENLATISINSKSGFSLNSNKSTDSTSAKKLSLKEDHFNVEHNLIIDKLVKDNRQLRNSIVNFGTHRYQKTIDELNQLNQNLIKSQERISTTNQYLEKKKTTLNALDQNLDQIFKAFDAIKLKI